MTKPIDTEKKSVIVLLTSEEITFTPGKSKLQIIKILEPNFTNKFENSNLLMIYEKKIPIEDSEYIKNKHVIMLYFNNENELNSQEKIL